MGRQQSGSGVLINSLAGNIAAYLSVFSLPDDFNDIISLRGKLTCRMANERLTRGEIERGGKKYPSLSYQEIFSLWHCWFRKKRKEKKNPKNNRQTDRQTDRQRQRDRETQRQRQTDRQTDRDRDRDRLRQRQRDRERQRQRQRDTETERDRERQRQRKRVSECSKHFMIFMQVHLTIGNFTTE